MKRQCPATAEADDVHVAVSLGEPLVDFLPGFLDALSPADAEGPTKELSQPTVARSDSGDIGVVVDGAVVRDVDLITTFFENGFSGVVGFCKTHDIGVLAVFAGVMSFIPRSVKSVESHGFALLLR